MCGYDAPTAKAARTPFFVCVSLWLLLIGYRVATADIVFQFTWSSAGATATPTGNSSTASGTFTINKLPGESFSGGDVVSIDVDLVTTGANAGMATVTTNSFTEGTIAGDGLGVTFTDFGLDLPGPPDKLFCQHVNCSDGIVQAITDGGEVLYNFPSQAAALASFHAVAIPEPSALLLGAVVCSVFTLIGRRQ